eukprot:569878-Lingulodinium_polyedra.AAC.1
MLSNVNNQRVANSVKVAVVELCRFYGEASKKCRSADGTEEWITNLMQGGDLQEQFHNILQSPFKPQAMHDCGFVVSSQQANELDGME